TNSFYSFTMSGSGGRTPYTWSATGLPNGLSMTAGLISGTPTVAGTSSVSVTLRDADGKTDNRNLMLTIYTPLTITTGGLPEGTVGSAYSQTLVASGGQTPYTWSLVSGSLPAGLNLSAAGAISGTPSAAGTSSFTVAVGDASSQSATKNLTIVINPALAVT